MTIDYNNAKAKCHRCGTPCNGALREVVDGKELPLCYDCYSRILYVQRLKSPYNEDEFC